MTTAAVGLGPRLRRALLEPEPPLAAFEVRLGSVGLVRLGREGRAPVLRAAASLELVEGTLALSVSEPNVKQPEAFVATLAALAERAGLRDGGRVGLVLPDPVARVSLVAAGELRPGRRASVEEMIRFRLRRSVPFDIRDGRVAHVEIPAAAGREPQSLVGAIAQPVLESYEGPLRELGFEPGLVELSGLALLRSSARDARGDELLVNWDHGYLSLFLTREGEPLLLRTLTGEPAANPAEVSREIASTVLYYRERLGGAGLAGARVRCGVLPLAEATALVEQALGLERGEVRAWGTKGWHGEPSMGQAVAGAAACVLGSSA